MNDISDAMVQAIKNRVASATLGTFLFFWLTYHWEGIYATIFVSQELIYERYGLLKNEYVSSYFFGSNPTEWSFYWGIIIPLTLTYLFVWWAPYVLLKAYEKEQWFRVEKRIIKINQERKIQEDRKELALETAQALKQETETAKVQRAAEKVDPKISWKKEYGLFDTREEYLFGAVLQSIYKHMGRVHIPSAVGGPPIFRLDPNALRLADSHGLVNVLESGERIELTDKGKYFASLYDGDI